MKSLQQILKENGQSPNQAFQTGKLKFDKTTSCLVYNPPTVNNSRKEKKSIQMKKVEEQ